MRFFHLTEQKHLSSIQKEGLIGRRVDTLVLNGVWADDIYPNNPLYLMVGNIDCDIPDTLIDTDYLN